MTENPAASLPGRSLDREFGGLCILPRDHNELPLGERHAEIAQRRRGRVLSWRPQQDGLGHRTFADALKPSTARLIGLAGDAFDYTIAVTALERPAAIAMVATAPFSCRATCG